MSKILQGTTIQGGGNITLPCSRSSLRVWLTTIFFTVCLHISTPTGDYSACAAEGPNSRPHNSVITPQDIASIRMVIDAAISPDGSRIAYLLRVPPTLTLEGDEKLGKPWKELYVTDLYGNSRLYVGGKLYIHKLKWTPKGEALTYLAKRNSDDHVCLYKIQLDGGESKRIASLKEDILDYSLSPDGRRLAILAKPPETQLTKNLKKKGFSAEVFEEDWRDVKLYIVTPEGAVQTAQPLPIAGSASEVHWSRDGNKLLLALAPDPGIDSHLMARKLHIINPHTGKTIIKLNNPGKLGKVAWNPTSTKVAFLSAQSLHDPSPGRLMLFNLGDSRYRELLPNLEGDVVDFSWTGSNRIRAIVHHGVEGSIYDLDLLTGKTIIHKVSPLVPHHISASPLTGRSALIADSPKHPRELFLLTTGKPQRLTHSNPWLTSLRLAKQESIRFQARDGLMLEGVLIHPLQQKPGQRYPLILYVHGGPESHISNGWLTSYTMPGQTAAARGFAVFYLNYRGSTGRGVKFSRLSQGDPAGKEFNDLLDAVDHLDKIGLINSQQVGVTGGSYGGYATAWCATALTHRFAAAVMFVGISDKISKEGTSDIPEELYLVHSLARPWEKWTFYLQRSPIYYVTQAHTPLLILHGKDDTRVHPSQSLELYRYLKILGKTPVRLVLYPGEGHGNRTTAARYDYNLRMLRWFEHYLLGSGKSPPPYQLNYGL